MSKYLKSNPDFSPWTEQDQEKYLKQARDKYVLKAGEPVVEVHWRWSIQRDPHYAPVPHKPREDYLVGLYDEGRVLGLLRLDFTQFREAILGNPRENWYRARYGRKCGHGWVRKDGTYEAKGSSRYRKPKKHVPIAESSEKRYLLQTKQDWRDRKGFDRDHKKSRWKRSCPASFRRLTAHERRAHERQMIHRADWDNQLSERNHDFIDRWMWD